MCSPFRDIARLCLVAALPPLAVDPARAAILEVRMEAVGGTVLPERVKIEAESVAGTSLMRHSFTVGYPSKTNELEVATGAWRVVVRARGLWTEEHLVTVEEAKDRKSLLFRMWTSGRIAGRVETPGRERLDSLEVTFESPPDRRPDGISRNTVRCPITDGGWSCELPATDLDIEFRVKGFISHHRWGLRVPASKVADIGVLSFRRGASVEGIVKTSSGARAGPPCRVSLKTGFGEPVLAALGRQPISATLNQRGFYQLVDMPPGRFVIEAEQTGWAKAATAVVVDQDVQVRVPPLIIDRPEPLQLALRPPRDPSDKPWMVQLLDAGSGLLGIGNARAATKEGHWRQEGLRPGPYLVSVSDSTGNRWLSQPIELPHTGPIQLDVEVLRVVGTVRVGDRPLRAELSFGGQHGALRVTLHSDEEGRFQGLIPKSETAPEWTVFVRADDPPVRRTFRPVKPQVDPSTGDAVVELVVPDVRLKGRVVDETGQPCPCILNAQSLDQIERRVQTRTGADGTFDVVGLAPGRAEVLCEGTRRSSGAVAVHLSKDSPTSVTLVAKRHRTIKGLVLTPEGDGIAGARVHAFPTHLPKVWLPPVPATSGPDGRFEIRVPHDTREVTLTAGAFGFALTSVRFPVTSDDPLRVALHRYGGTLQLEFPVIQSVDFYTKPAAYLVTELDYELLQNPMLQEWSTANLVFGEDGSATPMPLPRFVAGPTILVLPQMAPGPYSLCMLTVRETLEAAKGRLPDAQCVRGFLAPGGMLPLRVEVDAAR